MAQVELAHRKWAKSDENWRSIWWPKQSSVFKKVKPHRARILFWKSVNTCPKWFALPIFSTLSPAMAQVELAHKKWARSDENWRFGYKAKVRCSKNLSLIERGYFFLKIGKNVSKMVNSAQFFLTYPQLWLKWSLPTKNEPDRTKIDDLVTKTKVRCSKKLSLIERGYFFENR